MLEEATVNAASVESTSAAGLPAPAERGTTTISPTVFERLAAQAAAEVDGVEGLVLTGVDRFWPWADGSPAEATADVDDDDGGVVLDLTVNVTYPKPVRQVADRVRSHVSDRVGSLTGRRVREINITVADLVVVQPRARRVR